MKAKITVEFIVKDICNEEDLYGRYNTLEKMVKMLIKSEGLFGIVNDKYKILKIEELK